MRAKNNSGIILIVVLWMMVILSMLAMGLGHRTSIEIALTKHMLGKMRANYVALAGLNYVLDQIQRDDKDEKTSGIDTKYLCGFKLNENQKPEDLFKGVKVGDGAFDVYSLFAGEESAGQPMRYGLADEDSKININMMGMQRSDILNYLFTYCGCNEDLAVSLANNIIFGKSQVDGAENTAARKKFSSIEELLMFEGMTPEIFENIKDYITVFPLDGRFSINFDTAEKPVLLALARSFSGEVTNSTLADADSLIEKMSVFRRGDDGMDGTEDDRPMDINEMDLSNIERDIFLSMAQYQTKISRNLHVHIKGVDEVSGVVSYLEVIIDRNDKSIVYWHRN